MTDHKGLEARELRRGFAAEAFGFETTAELEETLEIIGQERAIEALQFGAGIRQEGYNLYALGPVGVGKHDVVDQFLRRRAEDEEVPSDWCYVHNFDEPNKPKMLELPAGQGLELRDDLARLIEELQVAIPAAFESDDYQTRRQAIDEIFKERQEDAFNSVHRKAEQEGVTILRTPAGIALAPVRDGEVIPPGEFEELPEEEREKVEQTIEELQEEMQSVLQQVPAWERERRDKERELNREVMGYAVHGSIEELREKYSECANVVSYLDDVEEDVVEKAAVFLQAGQRGAGLQGMGMGGAMSEGPGSGLGIAEAGPGMEADNPMGPDGTAALFRRYRVNVVVDHSETEGAPVVYEDQPTLDNLTGRVEYIARFGALLTDFNLIRPGAMHRANGGYLILDARKVLLQPFAWEQLKRVLRSKKIAIESGPQMMGMANTMSLEPQNIPLNLKVVLLGGRRLYYLLSAMDPEFLELFKVAADFEHDMDRHDESVRQYARYLNKLIDDDDLLPFTCAAIARVCERSSRAAGDREKFSTHAETMRDLLRESNYWATDRGAEVVDSQDVERAVEAKIRRNSRIRDRLAEHIHRDTLLIDTDGGEVGQINGLAVMQMGQFSFGKPGRITARVRPGSGKVVDIEREVDLGGPIHSKGVLILTGYLGARFATDFPLSLTASLVFEQSYGGVDGDSASLAEICALKSALSQLPLAQNVAVTGSVNQRGQVQPIGGVNDKIEGFFDVCERRGLTGKQGVIIPAANIKNLMVRKDVVDAVEEGKFHVWTVSHIDEATAILLGQKAGEADEDGQFPEDTINGRVQQRLRRMAERAVEFRGAHDGDGGKDSK